MQFIMSPNNMREQSLRLLAGQGLYIENHLPHLEIYNIKRTTHEILGRMLVLHVVGACAFGFDKKLGLNWIKTENLQASLTDEELDFLSGGVEKNYQFYPESVYAFAWMMEFLAEIDFWNGCPQKLVSLLPDLRRGESSTAWFDKGRLRDNAALLDKLDLVYCCHWAIREHISGSSRFFKITETELSFRRLALEWVYSDEDWLDISLDT